MKILCKFLPAIFVAVLLSQANAQRLDDVLATSTGMTYHASSLSPNGQKLYLEQRKVLSETRTDLLSQMIVEALLDLESKATGQAPEKLLGAERRKVTQPTAAEIDAVYKANLNTIGNRSIAEVRPQIVEFLKRGSEQKIIDTYLQTLRTKHKVVMGKDVNTIGLTATDVLATIGTRTITLRDFEQANRIRLNDTEMEIIENLKADLEASVLTALAAQEAKARNIDTSAFIAAEVTDKLRTFTDEERAVVENELMRRLFAKYAVKISLREPAPIVQNISVDDDPQFGNPAAPVTVVMFTDFQCPACSRTHPVLKQALQSYGDKVRLVVRDFPLEVVHENAFQAALAANAARNQGKFIEYTEILYKNQDALDKASLTKYATELGLNVKQFELDFSDAKTAAEVRKDQSEGRRYGIGGTPAIFVNGVKVHRLSLNGFRSAIDRALAPSR